MPTLPRPAAVPAPRGRAETKPFRSAEEAWFWTMAALTARRDGARIVSGAGLVQRPCEADDVVKCLDRLYRQRRIDLQHARILRIWGERQQAPDPRYPRERGDSRLWREAMARLDWPLRVKGIVDGPALPMMESADIIPFPGNPR
ncbi:hypothetical protein ACFQS7_19110 [Dankookia sp. GCM10030260]|uniref:hypothetical protein n=1 Tax=Dankookia sp. GCM10030260 TaxID=3273390 RepID=UPI003612052C